MRRFFAAFLACLCLAGLAACSHSAPPPVGRWEGTYASANAIVAARLEITPKGEIFLSAPNAENIASSSDEERAAIRQHLADGLEEGWNDVKPHPMDFDGRIFRRPGGIAPQAEWDPATQRMTLIVYLDKGDGLRIPMRAVKAFDPDPFSGA
jgi:hypothetical protein